MEEKLVMGKRREVKKEVVEVVDTKDRRKRRDGGGCGHREQNEKKRDVAVEDREERRKSRRQSEYGHSSGWQVVEVTFFFKSKIDSCPFTYSKSGN